MSETAPSELAFRIVIAADIQRVDLVERDLERLFVTPGARGFDA